MIALPHIYVLGGIFFAATAWFSGRDAANPHRLRAAGFWALLALSFLAGDRLGDLGNGVLVVALAVLATLGLGKGGAATSTVEERRASALRHGDKLFLVALVIPTTALLGTLAAKHTHWGAKLVDPAQATLVSLVLGVIFALAVVALWLRPRFERVDASGARRADPLVPLREGARLVGTVGWAAILPQMLASLGVVLLAAGVGKQVGLLFSEHLALDTRFAAVTAYCVGMAFFTVLMGNAFAAFPVMTAAVGLPVVVQRLGGDPAAVCAIGMLSGFCGTLLTPMAANFNIVPANLLDLPDRDAPVNSVIRTQAPTAFVLLAANILLMYALAFL
ncbi:MAG: DUF979 domain-containing protein [Candidatus Eisenbacteria bacterium]|uniref:DUF979 domain-containing protein n=1 Tax=Eiseniibacteriota bacterium TaxID=2212470 RepID=A0A933SGE1_UNCEI|nr:DUF979 domain-containing protein [Candidatus Eisenbacteria bacterium]